MYNRNDPRFRRAINEFSQTLESANEATQVGLFSFGHNYIRPCFDSVGRNLNACVAPCFPGREDRLRRNRARSRGRPETSFDFYDDWADDEWGNDEIERLLGEPQEHEGQQPGRQQGMSYGSLGDRRAGTKSAVLPYDGGPDPTVIPKSSYFGLFGRLPFTSKQKGLKYKPSAADLKTVKRGKGGSRQSDIQEEEEETGENENIKKGGRQRSGTTGSDYSGRTTSSYSSRGDIFPSDDEEYTDAIPIDDEFAIALERKATPDDGFSGNRPGFSRSSTSARSSRRKQRSQTPSMKSQVSLPKLEEAHAVDDATPIMRQLEQEEQKIKDEEELKIENRRDAAQKLARERGLSVASELRTAFSSSSSIAESARSQTVYPFPSIESPGSIIPLDAEAVTSTSLLASADSITEAPSATAMSRPSPAPSSHASEKSTADGG